MYVDIHVYHILLFNTPKPVHHSVQTHPPRPLYFYKRLKFVSCLTDTANELAVVNWHPPTMEIHTLSRLGLSFGFFLQEFHPVSISEVSPQHEELLLALLPQTVCTWGVPALPQVSTRTPRAPSKSQQSPNHEEGSHVHVQAHSIVEPKPIRISGGPLPGGCAGKRGQRDSVPPLRCFALL